MNSNANGEPGFCKQSFSILTQLAIDNKANGTSLVCSLIFDEMSIRKHLQWSDSQKKFLGYINYGFRPDGTEMPLANNAIVFMLNGINVKFTLPVAHYFIQSLKAEEKVCLLTEIIEAITACGVRVINISFDGLLSNITMCKLLGASFEMDNFKPEFILPGQEQKTYIILDPSHMLKLARNCVGNHNLILENGEEIKWKYFQKLEEYRVIKGYTLTHKLNKKHMNWENFKMNVRVAAETLSDSVANSMEYLMQAGYEEFTNASPTITFIRHINKIFDIMNTDKIKSDNNIFKNPIDCYTANDIFAYFNEATEYFAKIKITNRQGQIVRVINSTLRTAFRGFIINMINFRSIYEECVVTKVMDYLPTHRFSQDILEAFFGRIRSQLGHNDNPTVEQFGSAYRKIVVNNEIKCSDSSNCRDNLCLDILTVSSRRPRINTVENEDDINLNNMHTESTNRTEHIQIDNYEWMDLEIVSVAHLAGLIELKIENQGRFNCADCLKIFSENDKVSQSQLKNIPCQSTFEICSIAHKHVKKLAADSSYTYDKLLQDISCEFNYTTAYPKTNFENHVDHKNFFINFIAEEYIRAQATYIAKKVTLREQEILLGNKFKKIRQFKGQ